jgi:hypothetical protein
VQLDVYFSTFVSFVQSSVGFSVWKKFIQFIDQYKRLELGAIVFLVQFVFIVTVKCKVFIVVSSKVIYYTNTI